MKAAICTSDGVNVDQHFGKTSQFYIYSIEKGKKVFIEMKEVMSLSPSEVFLKESGERHDFDEVKFNSILGVLKGIERVYTTSIGEIPANKLKEAGIEVNICSCPIEMIPSCTGNCK